ncbi:MAG: Gfo/Idh/MocA family oxidoreductase [Lentisphaeria bacterium]|nr:Gfo/Idh/MocA family oxidoreductase [Lentisphaeria bacterium]
MSNFKWGILGPGSIASQFAEGLKVIPDAELYAVASRRQEGLDNFKEKFDFSVGYTSYEELAKDPDVDAIYIATPHNFHYECAMLCIKYDKPVLLEKPFTLNQKDALKLINYAREKQVFMMEAMWTRFFPAMVKVRECIAAGEIGEVRFVEVDFGFRCGGNPEGRLLNANLAGGALLDVGIYTVAAAYMCLGEPSQIKAMAHIGETNVDEQTSALLGYDNGAMAVLTSAIRTNTNHELTIYGTEGSIKVPTHFWKPEYYILKKAEEEKVHCPIIGNGYNYEAIEVMNCVRSGKLESAVVPLDETCSMMGTLDKIRNEINLSYPFE